MNLIFWQNKLYLAEPTELQRIAAGVVAMRTCPNAEQLEARAERWRKKVGAEQTVEAGGKYQENWLPESGVRTEAPRAIRAVKGKVGIISIHGPVDQHLTAELDKANGTPLDYVSAALDAGLSNAAIGAIVLHINSPGGGIYGTQELSDKIYNARGIKPIYAMVDSMACSAAYWIGTAASMIVCTPGGDVGSVGVYCMHVDESAALEKEGVKVTMVSAGKHKVEYSPFAPLSDDARAAMQESVDETHGKFIDALKRNRGTSVDDVRTNYGQGRIVSAAKALAAGMIDRILTFEELLGKLTGQAGAADQQRAVAEQRRLRMQMEHAQRKRARQ